MKHRFRMAEHSELHMVRDWGDAWRALVRPWLEAPAGLRRDFVLVPTRGQAQALKLRCVREGVPLLGVEFLTPGLAREKWRALAPPARPALGRELLLLHLRTLLAERQARLQPEDAAWGLWQSLLSDPAGALEAYDDLLTAGWSAEEFPLAPLRALFRELEQRVAAAGGDLAPRADRLAALAVPGPAEPRLEGRLLIYGFSAEHQREAPALAALARRAPDLTLLLPEPAFTGQGADERWIEWWESLLGTEARAAEPAAAEPAGAAVAAAWTGAMAAPPLAVEISVGSTPNEEMQLLADRLTGLLAAGADNIAVVFPAADAAHQRLVGLLGERGLPFNDLVGLVGTPPVEVQLFQALLRFLARGTRLEELLELWPLLPTLGFTRLSAGEAREVVGRIFDETQSHTLAANLAGLEADDRTAWREVARVARLLPAPWPDRLTLAGALARSLELAERFHLPRPESWSALQAGATRDSRAFPSAALLELLLASVPASGPAANAPGRGFFAPLTLTTRHRAAALEWSHLVLVEANAGLWPQRSDSGGWLPDEARTALEASRGRPPGGLLTADDRAELERAGWADLARQTRGPVIFTASRHTAEEPELPLAPNAWLERVLLREEPAPPDAGLEERFAALVRHPPASTPAAATPAETLWREVWHRRRDPSAPFDDWFFSADPAVVRPRRLAARLLERAVADPAELWFAGVLRLRPSEWGPLVRARRKSLGSLAHRLLAAALRGPPAGPGGFMARPDAITARTQLAAALAELRARWPADRYWDSFAAELGHLSAELLDQIEALSTAPFLTVEANLPPGTRLALGPDNGTVELAGRMDLVLLDHPAWAGAQVEIVDFKTGADQRLSAARMARGHSLQLGLYLEAVRTLGVAGARVWLVKPVDAPSSLGLDALPAALVPLAQLGRALATGRYGALTPDRTAFTHGAEWPLACPPIPHAVLAEKFARTFGSAAPDPEDNNA